MAVARSEPKPRERGVRADARRNRERILEAARVAFSEEGEGVQMDALARRAGVGVGTVYRHFPTKETLIRELGRHVAADCAETAAQAIAMPDPWESIVWLVHRNAEQMVRNVGLRETFSSVRLQDDCPFEAAALEGGMSALLARGREAGVLRDDVTTDDFSALMCGLSASIGRGGDRERLADILLDGLRARPR